MDLRTCTIDTVDGSLMAMASCHCSRLSFRRCCISGMIVIFTTIGVLFFMACRSAIYYHAYIIPIGIKAEAT